MAAESIELARLTRQVRDRNARLHYTLSNLSGNLRPSQLADEASRPLRNASSEFAGWAAAKATSPSGLSIAGLAGVVGATVLWASARRSRSKPRRFEASDAAAAASIQPAPFIENVRPVAPRRDSTAIFKFLAAAAIGVGLNRLLPASAENQAVMSGVGEELRGMAANWAKTQASSLIMPSPGQPFTVVNLAAIVAALFVAGREKQRV